MATTRFNSTAHRPTRSGPELETYVSGPRHHDSFTILRETLTQHKISLARAKTGLVFALSPNFFSNSKNRYNFTPQSTVQLHQSQHRNRSSKYTRSSASIRRLLCKVLVPEQGRARSTECVRNPRVLHHQLISTYFGSRERGGRIYLIRHTPRRDTDTVRGPFTRIHRCLIVAALISKLRSIGRQCHSDVELREGDLKPCGSEGCERLVHVWDSAVVDDQVSLGTDTVDGDAGGDEASDERDHGVDLAAGVVEVVVVDVKLCGGVGGFGGAEGNVDEGFTEHVVENGGAEGAVVVEDFVHDILEKG